MTTGPTIHTTRRSTLIEPAIIFVVCVLVYWIGLGSTGLSLSEGLRAIPAWEMMDSGDYFVTRNDDPAIVGNRFCASSLAGCSLREAVLAANQNPGADRIVLGREDATASVFEYIEAFDNRVRRHSSLGYVAPAEYERTHNPTPR